MLGFGLINIRSIVNAFPYNYIRAKSNSIHKCACKVSHLSGESCLYAKEIQQGILNT